MPDITFLLIPGRSPKASNQPTNPVFPTFRARSSFPPSPVSTHPLVPPASPVLLSRASLWFVLYFSVVGRAEIFNASPLPRPSWVIMPFAGHKASERGEYSCREEKRERERERKSQRDKWRGRAEQKSERNVKIFEIKTSKINLVL